MVFLRPGYLWLAVPALLVLTLLYTLKLRRRRLVVASLQLWSNLARNETVNSPFQRLRYSPLYLLQCLLIVVAVVATAQPAIRQSGSANGAVFLVVDSGLTMQTSSRGTTRLQAAKKACSRILQGLSPTTAVEVISAGSHAELLTPLTHDDSLVATALRGLRPDDTPPDVAGAIGLATNLDAALHGNRPPVIELVTDGCFYRRSPRALDAAKAQRITVKVVTVGQSRSVALLISSCSYAYNPDGSGLQILVGVHNAGDEPRSSVETVRLDGVLIDARAITVLPNVESQQIYQLPVPATTRRLEVSLQPAGPLPAAATAQLVIRPPIVRHILMVGTGTAFLKRALLSDPTVRLWTANSYPGAAACKPYDAVVFCNKAPALLPPGTYLFVHCTSNRSPAATVTRTGAPSVINWHGNHSVLQFVDPGAVTFSNALLGMPTEGSISLADSQDGSLVIEHKGKRNRQLFFGFDPGESGFLVSISFPILISNAVRWLTANSIDGASANYLAGESVLAPGLPEGSDVLIKYPDNHTVRLPVTSGEPYIQANRAGFYSATAPGYSWMCAVNCNATSAASLHTVSIPPVEFQAGPGAARNAIVTWHSIWRAAALLVLGLLCLEWWVYHRRTL
jgi:hypothetical protein